MANILVRVVDAYIFRNTDKGIKFLILKRAKTKIYEHLWQGVAGKIEKNEEAWQAAIRELKEETGYKAKELTLLTSIYPAIGFANEIIWIYLAQNLKMGSPNTDHDEFVETMEVDLSMALEMA